MQVEHLDDLILLGTQIIRCDISTHLEEHFPDHGHWGGISGGKLAIGWLLYILSESDHRLSHVEDWANGRLESLKLILGEPDLRGLDFCDDRLGRLLDRYSSDHAWTKFEQSLGRSLLEVYELSSDSRAANLKVVRNDSFNAPQYRESSGLFGYGYSKQRRADLPFCKVMVAALDPFSLPMAVEIVKGSGPDSNHYLSVINRAQSIFEDSGNLYVGDSQLGSLPNRLAIHTCGDYYLSPLNRKQCSEEELYSYLAQIDKPIAELSSIFTEPDSQRKPAYYYETSKVIKVAGEVEDCQWKERRILVYSPEYAKGLVSSFENRLGEAETCIKNLLVSKRGRKKPKNLTDLDLRIDQIIKKYKIKNCFEISTREEIELYKVQKHRGRPAEIREKVSFFMEIKRNEKIIEGKTKRLGWQIYATNAPTQKITSDELVRCYRNEYRIEHLFDYIINRDTGLLPIFLKSQKRVKALIRLLTLAMRVAVLIQYQVRTKLTQNKDKLNGVYPGNKNRSTDKPTIALLLRAFRGISIAWIEIGEQKIIQMTPLNHTQLKILELLGDRQIYQQALNFLQTHPNLRET